MSSTLEDAYVLVSLNEQLKKAVQELEELKKVVAELKTEPNASNTDKAV